MPATASPPRSSRLAGSYRDPAGYVFEREGRIFRAVDAATAAILRDLHAGGILDEWTSTGTVVATRFVDDEPQRADLAAEQAPHEQFLEHERLAPIAYPAEWSISMLADAAALTIDLHLRLLAAGCGLKDATAYNVQFRGSRPTFIDLSSVERPARPDVWRALGQFHRMFTYPLLLCRRGWEPRDCFSSRPEGWTPEQTARVVGRKGLLRPGNWLDLMLPLRLAHISDQATQARSASEGKPLSVPRSHFGLVWRRTRQEPAPRRPSIAAVAAGNVPSPAATAAQRWNLLRVRRKVLRLAAGYRPRSAWTEYARDCSYDEAAADAKRRFVADCLRACRPRMVLDLGCNTGEYSLLAATHAEQVVAIDADHDSIERLYRRLREEPRSITPLVVDLLAPTPAVGFRNRERPAFLARVQPDCVLALAVAHHLLVGGNLTPAMLVEQLFDLTTRDVVLEHVPPRDPMFRRLTRDRTDVDREGVDLPAFRRVLAERFEVLREAPLPHSPRTMLWLRKRTD